MMKRKLALCDVALCVALATAGPSGAQDRVRVAVSNFSASYISMHIAQKRGYYAASTEQRPGEFVHMLAGKPVRVTQQYRKLMVDDRPTILKIHGAVDREDETRDSYVVTEDHYIDYLARANLDKLIPVSLMREMKTSHFLFLG